MTEEEEEVTYPRYDDAGNLVVDPPVVPTEEEEVVDEDGGILDATQTSQSSVAQIILLPQTMQRCSSLKATISLRKTLRTSMSKLSVCLACALMNACNVKRLTCSTSRS